MNKELNFLLFALTTGDLRYKEEDIEEVFKRQGFNVVPVNDDDNGPGFEVNVGTPSSLYHFNERNLWGYSITFYENTPRTNVITICPEVLNNSVFYDFWKTVIDEFIIEVLEQTDAFVIDNFILDLKKILIQEI
jgi:hypothetical protein